MRDGVLVYECAVAAACPGGAVRGVTGASHQIQPGYYGLSPDESARIDPLGIGPSRALVDYWQKYPKPNDAGTLDGFNLMGYRFAAPIENRFKTLVGRADYTLSGTQRLFARVNLMHDAIESARRSFPARRRPRPSACATGGSRRGTTG